MLLIDTHGLILGDGCNTCTSVGFKVFTAVPVLSADYVYTAGYPYTAA